MMSSEKTNNSGVISVKSMALIPTVVIGGAGAGAIGVATSATAQAAPLQSQPPGTPRRPATGSRSSSTIVSGRLSTPPSLA
nr:Uncharacterised protein [Klebsiella pneumoniae]